MRRGDAARLALRRPKSPELGGYFFGFGAVAPGIFWLGAEAFCFGAASFFVLPLLSFIVRFP